LLVLDFLRVWDVALGHWFEIFCPFNICTHGCKLSSQDCLFCVPQVLVGHVFIFMNFHESFNFLFYYINDSLIIEQCVIQSPIICIFSAVVFVVGF
jgi:hypothetical protein